ncbi:MAG: hypothetical protein AAF351_16285 [Pseudomonadota bacterium]
MLNRYLFLVAYLAGLLSAGTSNATDTYHSGFADFSCTVPTGEIDASEALAPLGGTINLTHFDLPLMRIDIEIFEPVFYFDEETEPLRAQLLEGYLSLATLPLVRSGVPDAVIEDFEARSINDKTIMVSAISMPNASPYEDGQGNRNIALRCQAQHTNGKFVYTLSETIGEDDNSVEPDDIQRCLDTASKLFLMCQFPADVTPDLATSPKDKMKRNYLERWS